MNELYANTDKNINTNIDVTSMKTVLNKKTYKIYKNINTKDEKPNYTKKIKVYDFFIINEVKISTYLKKIPNYHHFYETITKYNTIEVGQMNKNTLDTLDFVLNTKNNDKYLLIEYNTRKNTDYTNNINNKENILDFTDFLFNIPLPKILIFHTLDSYSYLLDSLIQLNTNGVCFFDLCPENIFFTENSKPLLKNFQNSFIIDNIINKSLDKGFIMKIIKNIESFTHKPLEIHLLFYLIVNNEVSLSISIIETICSKFLNSLSVLSFFSEEYRENYQKECESFLKSYVNKPSEVIINEILRFYYIWDNYSLSILYLHIFGNMIQVFSLHETIINKLLGYLSRNIHPNPLKRDKLEKSKEIYHFLHNDFTDWSYVKNITYKKMIKLYEIL